MYLVRASPTHTKLLSTAILWTPPSAPSHRDLTPGHSHPLTWIRWLLSSQTRKSYPFEFYRFYLRTRLLTGGNSDQQVKIVVDVFNKYLRVQLLLQNKPDH